jgi:hypothetical protein
MALDYVALALLLFVVMTLFYAVIAIHAASEGSAHMPKRHSRRLPATPSVVGLSFVLLLALSPPGWSLDPAEEQRRFAAFDSNNDGRINQEEFSLNKLVGMFDPRWTSPSTAGPMRITAADSPLSPQGLVALDANGDGALTGAEVVASPLLSFDAFDTSADGFIDRAEFHAVIVKFFR